MLVRKMTSASISATLTLLIIAACYPAPLYEHPFVNVETYANSFIGILPIYMIYIMPVMFLYGSTTSALTEKMTSLLNIPYKSVFAWLLHSAFGVLFSAVLIFVIIDEAVSVFAIWSIVTILAASLYYVTDMWLYTRYDNMSLPLSCVLISLLTPPSLFILSLAALHI
ncbi:hypothetical protein [Paenibacillus sp. 481]|uniref:hypothetical protein n=1 Tax=Paenibacillus sp. 481 TaxID=2835869 RepID=UPI001E476170|nr:hypothetical protein [Paenibacillus sp. 481]UHA74979.1 hypothetical protein KIK04_08095 [Paenibacillus sp. 481]